MKKRRIAVITGSRAEYGLLYWLIRGIRQDPSLELALLVTGSHLSAEFGMTAKQIKKDGFRIAAKVPVGLSSDRPEAIAASIGKGISGFAGVFAKIKPDIAVVLGDRYEIFAAAAAAVPLRIPVAHIHGGEKTQGVFDEQFRHAITKMSHIHFPAAKEYADRIIRMGEQPKNVFCFGAPGLDNLDGLRLLNGKDTLKALGVPEGRKYGIVTFHPVTLEKGGSIRQVSELLSALAARKDIFWVFTSPNADTEHRAVAAKIKEFVKKHTGGSVMHTSLGQVRYLSALKHASVMAGNSSSGLIEAPSFGLPVVNIGDRQDGRIRARNVIDVPGRDKGLAAAISRALSGALSSGFRGSLKGMKNPYGPKGASRKILSVLKKIKLGGELLKKEFYDA